MNSWRDLWRQSVEARAKQTHAAHRCLYTVNNCGEAQHRAIQRLLRRIGDGRLLTLPVRQSRTDLSDQIAYLLGSEHDSLMFDARYTWDPRLLAAAVGSVVGGGVICVLKPTTTPAEPVHGEPGLFYEHRLWQRVDLHTQALPSSRDVQYTPSNHLGFDGDWRAEQITLLDQLHHHLHEQPAGVAVVQADRGRGKSAILGQISARLAPHWRIGITSLHQRATSVFMQHRSRSHGKDTIPPCHWMPVERAMAGQLDVLFVEEAASLPLPTLLQLTKAARHIVFATTVHGYEGAGRGFAVRFTRTLNERYPGWQRFEPTLPVRWGSNDPVEELINDALMLDVEPADLTQTPLDPRTAACTRIPVQLLIKNEARLRELFGLLVQAHYQTSAIDLKHLLNEPDMEVWTLTVDTQIVGAALIAKEGNLPSELHDAVMSGKRRPAQQMLPQLLAQCCQSADALTLRYARVVRIAIHPKWQRRGFGATFATLLKDKLSDEADVLGASFGADPGAVAFWYACGYKPCHQGLRVNPRSGYPSMAMLMPLSDRAKTAASSAHRLWLMNRQVLAQLSAADHATPMAINDPSDWPESPSLETQLRAFAAGHRSLINSMAAVHRLGMQHVATQTDDMPWYEWLLLTIDDQTPAERRQTEQKLRHWVGERLTQT